MHTPRGGVGGAVVTGGWAGCVGVAVAGGGVVAVGCGAGVVAVGNGEEGPVVVVVTGWDSGARVVAGCGACVRRTTGTDVVRDGRVVAAGLGGVGVAAWRGPAVGAMVAVVAEGSESPTGTSGVVAAFDRPPDPALGIAAIVRPPPATATAVATTARRRFLRQRACCCRRAARPPVGGAISSLTGPAGGIGSGICDIGASSEYAVYADAGGAMSGAYAPQPGHTSAPLRVRRHW
jgi:hypothetical protein